MSILFVYIECVPQKRESHSGLKQHDGEEMMTGFTFLVNYPFNICEPVRLHYYSIKGIINSKMEIL